MRPLFALAAVLGLAVACNSPTSPTPGTITRLEPLPTSPTTAVYLGRGTMSATVDGVPWTAVSPFGSTSTGPASYNLAVLTGIMPATTIGVSLTFPAVVGTYDITGRELIYLSLMQGFGTTRWTAAPFAAGTSGTLTVTTASPTHVAGTFSFTAVASVAGTSPSTRVVTNGAFDLSQ